MQKKRFFLELVYNGTVYHGWQVQENAVTVQQVLNEVLSTLLRKQVETVGCGRTDTGVHAKEFYLHFDTGNLNSEFDQSKFLRSLNGLLPLDIAVKRLIRVGNDAHARFDAIHRAYEYHIHFQKDPFKHNFSCLLRDKPDIQLMNEAARIILEYKDFSCFSKSNTQTYTNNCAITRAEWRETPGGIVFYISADRFLRNMVRAIVGTLLGIGRKEMKPEEIRNIIESKNRSEAGTSVPACGLYLTEVVYPYIERIAGNG